MRTMRYSADRLVLTAALAAVAAVLGLVEAWTFPPVPVPGVKFGLANLAVVVALLVLGPRRALVVSMAKVVIVGLFTGALAGPASLMAFGGAAASWAAMAAVASAGSRFSPVGWSAAGAFAHVAAQLAIASVLVGGLAPLYLAPVSLGLSLVFGSAVGIAGRALVSRAPLAIAASCSV